MRGFTISTTRGMVCALARVRDPVQVRGAPTCSVVILTRNSAATLGPSLEQLRNQTVGCDEVIVLDTESSDDTVRIARQFGARVIPVRRDEFDHGATRDRGAREVRGSEVVVFLVGDAIPCDARWLENLLQPFSRDDVAAVQGVEAFETKMFFWERPRSCLFNFTAEHRRWIRRYGIGFSNVCSAIRKDVADRIPFGNAVIGEDKVFQRDAAEAGLRIELQTDARVRHNHTYDHADLRRRIPPTGYGYKMAGASYGKADVVVDWALGAALLLVYAIPLLIRHAAASEWTYPLLRPLLLYRGFRMNEADVIPLVKGGSESPLPESGP